MMDVELELVEIHPKTALFLLWKLPSISFKTEEGSLTQHGQLNYFNNTRLEQAVAISVFNSMNGLILVFLIVKASCLCYQNLMHLNKTNLILWPCASGNNDFTPEPNLKENSHLQETSHTAQSLVWPQLPQVPEQSPLETAADCSLPEPLGLAFFTVNKEKKAKRKTHVSHKYFWDWPKLHQYAVTNLLYIICSSFCLKKKELRTVFHLTAEQKEHLVLFWCLWNQQKVTQRDGQDK